METGICLWFSKVRGFGFVLADADQRQLFVHWSQLLTGEQGQRNLVTDQRVTFVRKLDRQNRPFAASVEIVEESAGEQ